MHLPERTLRELKNLHAIQDSAGIFCLDLSLRSPDVEQLRADVCDMLATMGGEEVLPAAAEACWRHYLELPFYRRVVIPFNGHRIGMMVVTEPA